MGETEIIIFIVVANLVLLIFIVGIIVFAFQYRKRKLIHEKEKAGIEKQYKLELLNTQLVVQKDTMQFIGREIHDSVGQKLTLASIYSQKMEFENHSPVIRGKLSRISSIINDAIAELRELSKTLTDADLQNSTLNELLEKEREKINDAGGCKLELFSNLELTLGVNIKSVLYRVLQEFIQNSLKHSQCALIRIRLEEKPEGLYIFASDDGRGFDLQHRNSGGIGLSNMRNRVELIGGTFAINSAPQQGTNLELFIQAKKLF
ncbi:MAG: sensor histidine kinase [Chitinophagaceae bacterium]